MTVLAFDIPGTGESTVAMTPEGGADVVSSLVGEARRHCATSKMADVMPLIVDWLGRVTP